LLGLIVFGLGCNPKPPVINKFYTDQSTIIAGEKIQLHWSISGTDSVVLTGSDGLHIMTSEYSYFVNPQQETSYTLIVRNSGGTDNKTIFVNIDWVNTGDFYIKQGNNEHALRAYEKAIGFNVNDEKLWLSKAQCFLNLNRFEDAAKAYSTVISLNPFSAQAYYYRGLCIERLGQDNAGNDINKAIELGIQIEQPYIYRGLYNQKSGQYNLAVGDFSKAITFNPYSARAYALRGLAYNSLHEYDKAISDCDKAIEMDPKLAEAYFNRGFLYSTWGKYDKAFADFEKTIALDPKYVQAYLIKGDYYFKLGQYNDAITNYTFIIEIAPNKYADVYYHRGLSLWRSNASWDLIISDLETAARLNVIVQEYNYELFKATELKSRGISPSIDSAREHVAYTAYEQCMERCNREAAFKDRYDPINCQSSCQFYER
jgi:tetratricopeptide (TPR) repeat protein